MKVTTGSNSGCENKLAEVLGRLSSQNENVHVELEHPSKGPAIVTIKGEGLTVAFRMDLKTIRTLEGVSLEDEVRRKVRDAFGAVT